MLVLSPVVWKLLRLDGIAPAIVLAMAAVPVTIMGGQAGILQGERRWQALGLVYLGVGIPRLVIGTVCVLISPTETSAVVGVMLAMWVPVAIGAWALRAHRDPGETSDEHSIRPIAAEAVTASLALLAFFLLSNIDIIVARNALDEHEAGLYAGGLILTKAVLFMPQFVVVIAFPAMSTAGERRRALVRSLALIAALGAVSIAGAWLLSDLALVFVGGDEYAEVQSRLWAFAVLGTILAMLQLLVYSVLARRGTRSTYLVWAAVVVLVLATIGVSTLDALLVTVIVVDLVLLAVLTVISFWRLREPVPEPEPQVPLAG
jgi:O-antigen/teichoic acid export membrane protein